MSEPFLGELRLMAFGYAPRGWAPCNGQLLPINQNQALFSLLGTTFGGNGQTTFALPDLRGRVPIHSGPAFGPVGTRAGEEAHTLTVNEMPAHTHAAMASSGQGNQPSLGMLATANNAYGPPANLTALHPASVSNVGGQQPHNNQQPFLALNWCIALIGIFPSRN